MISKHLLFRAPEPSDIEILFQWENDSRIWHLSNTLAPYSRFTIEQFVLNTDKDIFAAKQIRLMIDQHTGKKQKTTIGIIDLFDFDPLHKRAGVGILIDEKYRRNGYAFEALQMLIDYCFNTLMLHQLFCNIEQSNTASIRLFKKAGFVKCGTKKDWLLIKNKWETELIFQLVRNN